MTRLLLLAGTGEARQLAGRLAGRPGLSVTASLAGTTREPADLPVPMRVGGFGGRAGFEAFLDAEGIEVVIDATHPFAHRISARTAEVCRDRGLAYLQLLRPEWRPGPGDRWTFITREDEAAVHVPPGATVFLATGRQSLPDFANLAGRDLICRQIDPPDAPFPFGNGRYLVGRPPFSVEDEKRLFTELGVDVLIVKNAGGAASRTKLDAARALGIPVVMIRRPPQPEAARVATVDEALAWLENREKA